MMKLRIEGLSIVPAGRLPSRDHPARADGRSSTWRCQSCGGDRHFPGPVSMSAAIPCPACGANALAVPPTEQAPRAQP
jgi:rubrerythrin